LIRSCLHVSHVAFSPAGLVLPQGAQGWGFGLPVFTRRDDLYTTPGRFGWDGGYGTSWYSDPREQFTGILLTQRMMDSPQPPRAMADFRISVYQAIDD